MSSLEDSVKHIVKDEVDDYLNSSGYLEMFEKSENMIAILQKRVRQLEVVISNTFQTENVDEIINKDIDFMDLYYKARETRRRDERWVVP